MIGINRIQKACRRSTIALGRLETVLEISNPRASELWSRFDQQIGPSWIPGADVLIERAAIVAALSFTVDRYQSEGNDALIRECRGVIRQLQQLSAALKKT